MKMTALAFELSIKLALNFAHVKNVSDGKQSLNFSVVVVFVVAAALATNCLVNIPKYRKPSLFQLNTVSQTRLKN